MYSTEAKYNIPDQMNLNNLASASNNSYTLISTSNSSWKLPIPQSLEYNSEFRWSAEELHHLAAEILQTITNDGLIGGTGHVITDMVDQIKNLKDVAFNRNKNETIDQTLSNLWKTMDNTTLGATLKQKMLGAAASMLGGGQALVKEYNKSHGVAYNPNEQLYFDGVSLRDFSLSFSLSPLSSQESYQIKTGLKMLTLASSPSFKENTFYFTYPSYFDVEIKVGGVTILERKHLAITSLNCNLSSEGPLTWHEDGMPTSLQVDIGFKETVLPTRENLANITFLGENIVDAKRVSQNTV